MTQSKYADSYLHQYELASGLAERPYTTEASEEMIAFLLSRKALEELPELREQVAELDARFAQALAHASMRWRREIATTAQRCGFAEAPWWKGLLREAAEDWVAAFDAALPKVA
jgi:hypothetical protein